MLIFGHIGITLGTLEVLGAVFQISSRSDQNNAEAEVDDPPLPEAAETFNIASAPVFGPRPIAWPKHRLAGRIDYRLVLAGSLLPDMVDKPLGVLIFGDVFSNGRIFGHSLLFTVVLGMLAAYLFLRHGKTWGFILTFGSGMHLLLDQMWSSPRSLLWPLYGWSFARVDTRDWFANLIQSMFTNPYVYMSEMVGVAVLALFFLSLARRSQLAHFVRSGLIE